MGFWGGVIGETAGSLVSGAFNAFQANKQEKFQERMSNTAHQREAEDLKKAGLNPILSANHAGASSPIGAMSRAENPVSGLTEKMQHRADSRNQAVVNKSLINKQNQEIKTMIGQQALNSAQAAKEISQTELNARQLEVLDAEIDKMIAETGLTSAHKSKINTETKLEAARLPKAEKGGQLYQGKFGTALTIMDKVMEYIQQGRSMVNFNSNKPMESFESTLEEDSKGGWKQKDTHKSTQQQRRKRR